MQGQNKALPKNNLAEAIMDTVLDGIVVIDAEGIIQSFNPSAIKLFGYTPEEVIGKNVSILMPEPYKSQHDRYISNYLGTKEAKVIGIGREVMGRRKNGETFPMELGVSEMRIGKTNMFVGTIRDITERKNAEEEINSYITALKKSNQELDDFAYIASHDLKEPLRGLNHNSQFLKDDFLETISENGVRRIDRMIYLCERMERLVNDLLHFSRIGKQELAVQKVDLNTVIHDILIMMETTLNEENVKIKISKKLPTITCDMVRITELFRNLITNSIKYNDKPEKRIEIGYKKVSRENKSPVCVFYVKDNGIGIQKQFYQDIFRIFKRLNDEDDSKKGTGVGLSFVKKIIERHGGQIWLDSKVSKGTTFYFTIERNLPDDQKSFNHN